MKGFIVANRINDIYFMDNDEEFAVHVNKQAKEQGLINEVKNEIYNVKFVNKRKHKVLGFWGIGSVRPSYTFALGPFALGSFALKVGSFALKVGPFALIIKKVFK